MGYSTQEACDKIQTHTDAYKKTPNRPLHKYTDP